MGQGAKSRICRHGRDGQARIAVRLLPALPLLYLALHGLALVLIPSRATFLLPVPECDAPAGRGCLPRQASLTDEQAWLIAVALAMILWSAGMATSMVATLFAGISVDGLSVLLYAPVRRAADLRGGKPRT